MFLVVVAHPCSSPGQRAVKWLCVCVCVFKENVVHRANGGKMQNLPDY